VESWNSLHPDGLHQESIWSIPGVHQDSLIVHSGCYLERGPDGLQEDSWWSPSESVAQCNYLNILVDIQGCSFSRLVDTCVFFNCCLKHDPKMAMAMSHAKKSKSGSSMMSESVLHCLKQLLQFSKGGQLVGGRFFGFD
jgi:hypothetical protein